MREVDARAIGGPAGRIALATLGVLTCCEEIHAQHANASLLERDDRFARDHRAPGATAATDDDDRQGAERPALVDEAENRGPVKDEVDL
jgi:hypothetical protein